MADLSGYQPSSENLLINGDFSLEILDGGFDWMHQKTRGVALALDPNETHSSPHSLRIIFDGPGIEDAGIRQMVSVEPNTSYEFSGFYKASDMDGAGGTKFAFRICIAKPASTRATNCRTPTSGKRLAAAL